MAQSPQSREKGQMKAGVELEQVQGCQVTLRNMQARNGVQKNSLGGIGASCWDQWGKVLGSGLDLEKWW